MIHSPSEVLAQCFVDAGQFVWDENLVTPNKWPVKLNVLPDVPNNIAVIYDTQGVKDARSQSANKRTYVHRGTQIMLRGIEHATAWMRAGTVEDFLDTVVRVLVTIQAKPSLGIPSRVYRINTIVQTSPVLYAGTDGKQRPMYSLNLLASIEEVS